LTYSWGTYNDGEKPKGFWRFQLEGKTNEKRANICLLYFHATFSFLFYFPLRLLTR